MHRRLRCPISTTSAGPTGVIREAALGVIAAWNYAYYVRRDAVAARALATSNSSVVPAEQLQPFIDDIPVGTNYCVRTKALSPDVYLVDLSELRPRRRATHHPNRHHRADRRQMVRRRLQLTTRSAHLPSPAWFVQRASSMSCPHPCGRGSGNAARASVVESAPL